MDHFQLRNGELYCEDVRLAEIAATVEQHVYEGEGHVSVRRLRATLRESHACAGRKES